MTRVLSGTVDAAGTSLGRSALESDAGRDGGADAEPPGHPNVRTASASASIFKADGDGESGRKHTCWVRGMER